MAGALHHPIEIENSGETYACAEDTSLLAAMEQLCRKGIPVGCRNGGCGVCKVQLLDGRCERRKMSRAVISADEEAQGLVLACRASPRSAVRLRVVGKMVRSFADGVVR
jgi:ferredoxin